MRSSLESSNRILIVDAGCYVAPDGGVQADAGASYPRQQRGIEAVRISDGTSTWLYQHDQADRLASPIWADGTHAFRIERAAVDAHRFFQQFERRRRALLDGRDDALFGVGELRVGGCHRQ